MKKVGIVILNYKLKEETVKCVESVRKSSHKDINILVVDNGSDDGIEGAVKRMPGIEFIQTGANLGYAGGNNAGISRLLQLSTDYIFVLNPDTTVDPHAISRLVAVADSRNCGILGPKIYFDGSKRIFYAGGIFDSNNVLGLHRGVNEEDKGQYDETVDTDFVTGAAIFANREVFEKIGLFDERYFLYYEDTDLCIRAKRQGISVMYTADALIYHANAKATGLGSPLQDYFITRNRMLLAYKFLSFRVKIALMREALRNFKSPARRLAFWDYLMGNFGKGSFLVN